MPQLTPASRAFWLLAALLWLALVGALIHAGFQRAAMAPPSPVAEASDLCAPLDGLDVSLGIGGNASAARTRRPFELAIGCVRHPDSSESA